jgi:hypothetical protein
MIIMAKKLITPVNMKEAAGRREERLRFWRAREFQLHGAVSRLGRERESEKRKAGTLQRDNPGQLLEQFGRGAKCKAVLSLHCLKQRRAHLAEQSVPPLA